MAGLSPFSATWHSAARELNASASHTKAGICFICRIPMTPAVCRHRHKAPAPRFSTPGPSEAHPQIHTVEAADIVLGQRECAQLSPCPTLHEVRESTSAALGRSRGLAMPHQPLKENYSIIYPPVSIHLSSTCLWPTCYLSVICLAIYLSPLYLSSIFLRETQSSLLRLSAG